MGMWGNATGEGVMTFPGFPHRGMAPGKSWYYSLIIVGAWSVWNYHNGCVFDGIQPSLNRVLAVVKDELHLWIFGWLLILV
ncbi:hypothetical protein SORBI_3006G150001 [Sorghum bicolor]|uniref:Uncharacterized protein n=1 Tax=Sorghum bicolor TaxID=4558 RepID=A0A1Z5RE11_SORBI|nr:hypothetical protein SORBI_3006G150001 [Sorghum bicolor]